MCRQERKNTCVGIQDTWRSSLFIWVTRLNRTERDVRRRRKEGAQYLILFGSSTAPCHISFLFCSLFLPRCLLHEVEGEENDLPAIIPDVRVVDVQPICVDEAMRRRFKCLGHLPQMSQATLVDIDLRK